MPLTGNLKKEWKKKRGLRKVEENKDVRIVILQRGWVAVGYFSKTGSECRLDKAAIIRLWGTTKGLGEIAENGPTEKTVLDKSPTIIFHELTVIAMMLCQEDKWKTYLS